MSTVSVADVVVIEDKVVWMTLVESFATINFTGFEIGTPITTQYADLGILFTDRHDFIDIDQSLYPNDEAGLYGGFRAGLCDVRMDFLADQFSVAVEYNGKLELRLYRDGKLRFESPYIGEQHSGNFLGVISDEPFDEVHVVDSLAGTVFIDDLHFGPPICVADVDEDEAVGFEDLVAILSAWGNKGGREDLDANGVVDFDDLLVVLDAWGPCE